MKTSFLNLKPLSFKALLATALLTLSLSNLQAQVYNQITRITECIDPALIDTSASIPAIYAPVCGCDGITYSNSYEARLHYGLTEWTAGPCRTCELDLRMEHFDYDCVGATACVLIENGAAPYRLFFRHNNTDIKTVDRNLLCYEELEPGNYELIVVDAEGCMASLHFVVPAVNTFINAEISDVSCNGGNDGSIALIVPIDLPLHFRWVGPNGFTADTEDIDGLVAGNYKVKIFHEDGSCYKGKTFEVKEPRTLKAEFIITSERCEDGVDGCLIVKGGTPAYHLWAFRCPNPTTIPPVPVFNANNVPSVDGMIPTTDLEFAATDSTIYKRCARNIPAGTYYVLIVDANRCWEFLRIEIPEVIGLDLSAEVKNVSCAGGNDGAIELRIAGGTPPFEAFWTNDEGETGAEFQGLKAGKYRVMVYDARQCSATITVEIKEPSPLRAEFIITSERCENGVDGCLIVNGGTLPYHLWVFRCATPTTNIADPIFNPNGVPTVDGMTATTDLDFGTTGPFDFERCAQNIPAGIYYVLIVDANRCWKFLRIEIPNVSGITLEGAVKNVSCAGGNDGAIDLHIEGGTAPFEAFWTNEEGETGREFRGLSAGKYLVTVYDARQCSATARFEIKEPAVLEAEFEGRTRACGNGTDGCLTISGGTMPYRLWVFTCPDPQPTLPEPIISTTGDVAVDGMVQTTAVDFPTNILPGDQICAEEIPAGIYYVLVLDANNCWVFKRIVIEENPGLELFFDFDAYGAFACVDPLNGTAPYTIKWTHLDSGNVLDAEERFCVYDLRPGAYLVEVTDANGCSASELFFIEAADCYGGEAIVDPAEIRSGENTSFLLSNYEGERIQWQFKTAATEWLNIPGAATERYVSPSIHTSVDKEIAVRAAVQCNDGTVVFSSIARLFVHGNPNLNIQDLAQDRQLFDGSKSQLTAPQYDLVNVFPTISEGRVNIRMNADTEETNISIMDLNGQVYRTYQNSGMGKGEVEELDLSGIPTGMYLVRVVTQGTQMTQRIIVQRK